MSCYQPQDPGDCPESRLPAPRHLLAISATAAPWAEERFGELCTTVFSLRCTCGGDAWELAGGYGDDTYVDRLTATCCGCGAVHSLHDRAAHGYEALLVYRDGGGPVLDQTPRGLRCPSCELATFEGAVGYQNDVDEDTLEDLAELPGSPGPEDAYHWIFGGARCKGCGHAFEWADMECA